MRPDREAGFSLIEVLTVMTVSLVILGATLTTFEQFVREEGTTRKVGDAQDQIRRTLDVVARQLRNLANPTAAGSSIDRATGYDFVFQTSDPARLRVRYCLASGPGGTGEKLWQQTATASGALNPAAVSACPAATGWDTQSVVGEHLVNRIAGADRPVFGFGCSSSVAAGESCHATSATYVRITTVRAGLFLDVNDADDEPVASRLATQVFLRNQNEPPTVSFVAAAGGPRTVALNGSGSADPEGRTLRFEWFAGTGSVPAPTCAGGPAAQGAMGEGVTVAHAFDPAVAVTQHIRLRVTDPGCLYAVSESVAIDPATGSPAA